jgi:hypothetical protein
VSRLKRKKAKLFSRVLDMTFWTPEPLYRDCSSYVKSDSRVVKRSTLPHHVRPAEGGDGHDERQGMRGGASGSHGARHLGADARRPRG